MSARPLLLPFTRAGELALAVLAVAFAAPLALLPEGAALALGRFYGRLVGLVSGTARRAGMINLRRAYGAGVTPESARRDVDEVFANLGRSVAEGIRFALRHRSPHSGWESLYAAEDPQLEARLLADPRPKVFVTGHLGSWEIASMMLALRTGGRGAAVTRRIDNPFLDALVRRVRVSEPGQWIEKRGAVAAALAALRAGRSVVILLDENGGRRGPFVPFFGRAASTRKTAALLSVLTGAPLVVGAAVRRPGPRPFLFRLALLEPDSTKPAGPATVLDLTARAVAVWERWVREDPLQWRWIHWRWRTRPDGSEETYGAADVRRCFAGEDPAPGTEGAPARR